MLLAELAGRIFVPMTAPPLPMTTAEARAILRGLIDDMKRFDTQPTVPPGATVDSAEAQIEALQSVLNVMSGASGTNLLRALDQDAPDMAPEFRAALAHAVGRVQAHIEFIDNWIDCTLLDETDEDTEPARPWKEVRERLLELD